MGRETACHKEEEGALPRQAVHIKASILLLVFFGMRKGMLCID